LFDNVDEISNALVVMASYVSITNKNDSNNDKIDLEEKSIKTFIDSHYTITTNVDHRLKASEIQDIILRAKECKIDNEKISGFKNRLSKYLKEIGLEKKRYNDGYYYYGLFPKSNISIQSRFDKYIGSDELVSDKSYMLKDMNSASIQGFSFSKF